MLQNIQPARKRSKGGSLSKTEKPLVKGLLELKYLPQDIVHIVNQGRSQTINLARVTEVKNDGVIKAASEKKVREYIKIQSSYDPKTLLNPYKDHRIIRAREAMISAVTTFNNPSVQFKTEMFCVLANIAWTYLLHEKMEQTEKGSSKLANGNSVTVSGTLDKKSCPIKDDGVKKNLEKIIEIRDAVEHTFFVGGEQCFGPLFQACCVNFDRHLIDWFGESLTLSNDLSLALQFVRFQHDQAAAIEAGHLPKSIKAISDTIHADALADNNAFLLKVYYTTEATSKTNADIQKLVNYGEGGSVTAIKKVARTKLTQKALLKKVKEAGFKNFSVTDHQNFWQSKWPSAKERNLKANKEYGEDFNGWGWYEDKWLPLVLKHCEDHGEKFK